MAPPPNSALKSVEENLRAVIETLYEISVGVHEFQGPESVDVIANLIDKLSTQYQTLDSVAAKPELDVAVPREVIQYIEDGRNPDIYTREFIEIVVKQNQFMKGKMEAYRDFRDVLADQIKVSFPELTEKVDEVIEGTGGRKKKEESQNGGSS
ncbi:mediator complex, subunit Med10 [Tuber borchii]|uniref:Mediator of RNA polymerase II transcription subunit 10 n=1 Tax=Tuber borchii TaxID=42251 RepID=A0A2T6ZFM9_TUBBO|nr:mediator complex, subunit Med10 [Tuber borchii]